MIPETSIRGYTDYNAQMFDRWVSEGWEWGQPISHETYLRAQQGEWNVVLTPNKPVPHVWLGKLEGKRVLGLASGGGQQMPIFAALGAECYVLDYSEKQLASERAVAEREGYEIQIEKADMTNPLPYSDNYFDLIFHPVSNCYIEQVEPVWRECYRILKPDGRLLSGLDNGFNFLFDDEEHENIITGSLPFNPLRNKAQKKLSLENDCGYQFSHTIEEQIGGQIKAGFRLVDLYEDTNSTGFLKEHGVPTFWATLAIKE